MRCRGDTEGEDVRRGAVWLSIVHLGRHVSGDTDLGDENRCGDRCGDRFGYRCGYRCGYCGFHSGFV